MELKKHLDIFAIMCLNKSRKIEHIFFLKKIGITFGVFYVLSPCFYIWDKIAQECLLEKGVFFKKQKKKRENFWSFVFSPYFYIRHKIAQECLLEKGVFFRFKWRFHCEEFERVEWKGKMLEFTGTLKSVHVNWINITKLKGWRIYQENKTLSQPSTEISSSGERLLEGKLNVKGRISTRYEGNQAKRYDGDDDDDDCWCCVK